jgi:hypothetical protein
MSQYMAHAAKKAAARLLGCSRRTVQRYCKKWPSLVKDGRVDVDALGSVLQTARALDGRGWKLGRRRQQHQLALGVTKKEKPFIRRTLSQRLEIIAREVGAMSDEEQALILAPDKLLSFFRPTAINLYYRAHDIISCANCGTSNRLPRRRPPGTPRCGKCKEVLN